MKTAKTLAILYLLLGTIAAYSMDEAPSIPVKSVTFNTANDSNNTSPAMMSRTSPMTALSPSANNSPVVSVKSITSPMAVTKRLLDEEYFREVQRNEDSDDDSSDSDADSDNSAEKLLYRFEQNFEKIKATLAPDSPFLQAKQLKLDTNTTDQ